MKQYFIRAAGLFSSLCRESDTEMRKVVLTTSFLFGFAWCTAQSTGTFTDPRDSQIYNTVTYEIKLNNGSIKPVTWMAQDLNYNSDPREQWGDSAYYNCYKYWDERNYYLYPWVSAMNVCPSGWHLPSNEDWESLIDFLGGPDSAGISMKSRDGWEENGNGTNKSMFNGFPNGWMNTGMVAAMTFTMRGYDEGVLGCWWSTEMDNEKKAYYYYLVYNENSIGKRLMKKNTAVSVRCIKD